jgi:MFS transporter, ACS family, glucarate transporter
LTVRHKVLGMTVALAFITYLDRVCIAIAAPNIMRELSLSTVQMSYVFSAFTVAYGIFEIPTGWWGDRVGTRRVLTRIVLWWSTFTAATAGAWNYASLLTVRFLFGIGEAGAWPNAAKTFPDGSPSPSAARLKEFSSWARISAAALRRLWSAG